MVFALRVLCLVLELSLVGDDVAGAGRPGRLEGAVAGDPFGADVGVDLDLVGGSVGGMDRDLEVGEGQGALDEVGWLRRCVNVSDPGYKHHRIPRLG